MAVASLMATARGADAQNFAPIATASAPEQAWTGQPVTFSSSASIDPDAGPQPLTYRWDFDDGTTSTDPSPAHAFDTPRAYAVTLTVSDGADSSVDLRIVHVLAPPLEARSRHSSALALSAAGDRLFVANPDSNSVSTIAITASGLELIDERALCKWPRTIALADDGATLFAACQGERAVAALDLASGMVAKLAVGAEPYGVVALIGGGLLVTNQSDDSVTWFAADLVTQQTWATATGPRAIAVSADGTRAYVTSYLSRDGRGTVAVHDLLARAAIGSFALAPDPGPDTASSGRGTPNLLSAAAIDPAGRRLWVGGLKSNAQAGLFRSGTPIASVNWLRGLAAPIDLATGNEIMERRIDTNDADSVSAIAFSADGRHGYFAHQGAGTVSIYDLSKATLFTPGAGTSVPFEGRVDTGDAPQAIAIAPDGATVFVLDYLSRDVAAVDVRIPTAPVVTSRLTTTQEPLPPELILGKRLFYRSREPVHSKSNYVACASCHADGGSHDGQIWDLTQDGEGLRNTIDLRGRAGLGHGRVHWSANFDEIQDFENPIVKLFGGTGLAGDGAPPHPPLGASNAGRSAELDALAAYVTSLAYTPRSPRRHLDGNLDEAAARGEALFHDPALRCADCHPAPSFTISTLPDGALIDVGTLGGASGQRLGASLAGIDVPTLLGLWDGAPYYHDGSARTLRDVFRGRPTTLEAQLTAQLEDAQLDDLLAYLVSLDAPEPEPSPEPEPPDDAGCGCASTTQPTSFACILALIVSRRRRRSPRTGGIS